MSKKEKKIKDLNGANDANDANDEMKELTELQEQVKTQEEEKAALEEEKAALEEQKAELEDKNLRMMAEFDNFRKRTNKEKLDLMATAGERIFTEMLPLVDDFERALASINGANDTNDDALLNGVQLIYQKFVGFLEKNDVHVIETEGVDFNTDEHEAVTTFAAGEEMKGKVIDCTQKGYKLGDKVIRFAKVVVGE
ncbi:MAG: nucleotide exchange factor GrpE [Paludibacteraceae bacterium]|nr:nucleotide exchange factor GrpE [Paludibacteraceae bacterium]